MNVAPTVIAAIGESYCQCRHITQCLERRAYAFSNELADVSAAIHGCSPLSVSSSLCVDIFRHCFLVREGTTLPFRRRTALFNHQSDPSEVSFSECDAGLY